MLFTVKGYDTDGAIAALQPVVGLDTAVLTLQNGIDSADRLNAVFGTEDVIETPSGTRYRAPCASK